MKKISRGILFMIGLCILLTLLYGRFGSADDKLYWIANYFDASTLIISVGVIGLLSNFVRRF